MEACHVISYHANHIAGGNKDHDNNWQFLGICAVLSGLSLFSYMRHYYAYFAANLLLFQESVFFAQVFRAGTFTF